MRATPWWLVILVLLSSGCVKKPEPREVIAHVGDIAIDRNELVRSYALHPQWKRGETEFGSYLTQLNELITQKVYASEACKLGIQHDSLMAKYLEFLKEKEMIKGLYRRQVREKIQVSEAEERQMYAWLKKRVDFEYVSSYDSAHCAAVLGQWKAGGVDRFILPSDSSVSVGKREGIEAGSLAPELERVLFPSRLGDVKGPVRVGDLFMAVKLTGGTQDRFLSENDFLLQRAKIEKMLNNRKADSIALHYVHVLMSDKDLRLNAPVFWTVAGYFARRVKEAHVDPMKIQNVNVTGDELEFLQGDLSGMADAVVATHREGRLTVRELLNALAVMPGSLRPHVRTPQNLKEAIGRIVRNQYLLREAEREDLDRDADVLYEYGLQRDETLSSAYYERRRSQVPVSPEEVEKFRKTSPVSEEQVFFRFNMTALARDAKTDSLLNSELPLLKAHYAIDLDTAKVRSMSKTPDAVLKEDPLRIYVREIFQ